MSAPGRRGVTYQWKEPEKQGNMAGTYMGLIGQEVEQVFPEWVKTDALGYKDVTVTGFEALTVEAIREIKTENEALKARVMALEAKMSKGAIIR